MPSRPHSSGFCRAGAKRTVSFVRPATSKERVRRSADLVALQEKRAQTHKPSQRATVGARNAPTQAAEAQKPLQQARTVKQQSRSRSRDRQIEPGAQPPTQQSRASQQQARNSLVAKLEAAAQQPQRHSQQSRARQQQARANFVENLENGAQKPQWNKAQAGQIARTSCRVCGNFSLRGTQFSRNSAFFGSVGMQFRATLVF